MPVSASRASSDVRARNTTSDRTLDVLMLFDDQRTMVTALDVSELMEMPRSTTYRYLQSLRSYGLLEEESGGRFRLGPRVLELARVAWKGLGLPEISRPIMRELSEHTHELVLLSRWSGNHAVIIERVESDQPLRLSYERGYAAPLRAASAKVLLAALPAAELSALDLDAAYRAELPRIRERGYGLNDEEVDAGVRAVAAPVTGAAGQVLASLAVVAPSFRLTDAALPSIVQLTRRAAEQLSRRLIDLP